MFLRWKQENFDADYYFFCQRRDFLQFCEIWLKEKLME